MQESRRTLLIGLAALAGAASLQAQNGGHPNPQPMPSPNAPTNPNAPAGLNNAGVGTGDAKAKAIAEAHQKAVKDDVEKLYEMVSQLKQQVESTNLSSTLPVSLVKQAKEIEKLAKQIRENASG